MEKDFSAEYFLSNLSHQIRTPLNGIIGYLHLLSQTKLDKTQQSYVNSINICSIQLIGLINDILDFSKLTTGKAQIKNECFSLNEIIEEVNATIGSKIKEKKQILRYVINNNVPNYIVSDKQKIIQIIINLISNANKFSHNNGTIIFNAINCSNNIIKFTVTDNGIGISEESQKLLFNPFVQVQDSLTKNGSGLGLAICKKLVEILGGEISLQSSKNNGCTFTFTIKYEAYDEFKKYVEKNQILLKNKNILIADDNLETRISIGDMLFDSGIQPIICSSSKEVLRMITCKRYIFDIIILDSSMNYIPGSPFAKQIKEIDPEIPIIALSTFNDSIDPLYFEKIIYKPVNKLKLLDTLYNIINKNDITPFQINELTETKCITTDTIQPTIQPTELSVTIDPIKYKEIKIIISSFFFFLAYK